MGDSILDLLWGALVGEIVGTVLLGGLLLATCNPEVKRQLPVEWGGGGEEAQSQLARSRRARAYPLKIDRDIRLL